MATATAAEPAGLPGDSGLIIGGLYQDSVRRVVCMADHALKGIWLNGLVSCGDDEYAWCGTRSDFDAHGWQPCEERG